MSVEQQIANLEAALRAVDVAIAQTEAALVTATASDKPSLRSALADLRTERTALQLQLDNLRAAAVVVEPLGAPRMRSARSAARAGAGRAAGRARSPAQAKALNKRLARETLKLARNARAVARTLRMIGDDPTEPVPRPRQRRSG